MGWAERVSGVGRCMGGVLGPCSLVPLFPDPAPWFPGPRAPPLFPGPGSLVPGSLVRGPVFPYFPILMSRIPILISKILTF